MELSWQTPTQSRKSQSNSRRNSTTTKQKCITNVPSKSKLLTQVCVLPPILLSSVRGFTKIKTVSLKDVVSADNIIDIMRGNSESLQKYQKFQSEFTKRQRHYSVHNNVFKDNSIFHSHIKNSKNNLSPVNSIKASYRQKQISDALKISINPKYRQSVRKTKQHKKKLKEMKIQQYYQSLSMQIKIQRLTPWMKSPECREGAQIWVNNKRLYLFGGHSRNNKHSVQCVDFNRKQWMRLEIEGYRRRSFHSLIVIKKQIIQLFGFQEPALMEHRRLTSEIDIINMENKSLKRINTTTRIKPRFDQSACLYSSSQIMVSGGRNLGDYFKDCWLISILTEEVKDVGDLPFEQGLAGHQMCMARQNLYLFGGRSGDGQFSDKLLHYDPPKNKFVQTKTHGKTPEGCYGHSMRYLKQSNLLLIFGGKNDNMANPFLNQVVVYNEQLSTYFTMKSFEDEWFGKDGFYVSPATHYDNNIVFVYGGINLKGINNCVYILDFDVKNRNIIPHEV